MLPQQELDKLPIKPIMSGTQAIVVRREVPLRRLILRSILPRYLMNTHLVFNPTILGYEGEWVHKAVRPGREAGVTLAYQVTAFGIPIEGVRVYLFRSGEEKPLMYKETDENGMVFFNLKFTKPGVYDYIATLKPTYPMFHNTPWTIRNRIVVWLIVVKSRRVYDRWARWLGRAYGLVEHLPYYFWDPRRGGKYRFIMGLAGRRIGYFDLVPVVDDIVYYYELGVSAYCGTSSPRPSRKECCEVAKRTRWEVKVYATNNPREVDETIRGGANYIGGDKILLDWHLVYKITKDGVYFLGKCLLYPPRSNKPRCPWLRGTAPMCEDVRGE